jgi:two-component system LytT family sensor kinase/two-component system sensor histidine kinase LytS
LHQEWSFTKDYFEIENMRLENKVELVAKISEQASQFSVPPLILQPLVENSMKHGIFESEGSNVINVQADVVDGTLYLCVKDNGSGDDSQSHANTVGSRQGLLILAERLGILYAKRATLTIENKGSRGFQVYITIPGDVRGAKYSPGTNFDANVASTVCD